MNEELQRSASPAAGARSRTGRVLGAAVLAAAVVGFLTGVSFPGEKRVLYPTASGAEDAGEPVPNAVSYRELRSRRRGRNDLYASAWEALRRGDVPIVTSDEKSAEAREDAQKERARRRAYAGAPPTVPHEIEERQPSACMTCHGESLRVGGLRASMMSHGPRASCTQCHAANRIESAYAKEFPGPPVDSRFVGAIEPGNGSRAWAGAPPTIPHSLFNREICASCHGSDGSPGLRTSHAERANCVQCHAPSASFDPGRPASGYE